MAGSRWEKVGTIFSRMTGLIRAGAINYEDRPIWFDVYKAIPPKEAPKFERTISEEPVKEIFYPEDIIRARFHKYLGRTQHQVNISDNINLSSTQKMIDLCEKFQKENNMNEDEAFDNAISVLKSEGIIRDKTKTPGPTPDSVMASFREAMKKKEKEKSEVKAINMKEILKDE